MEEVKVMEYLVKFESSLISVNENIISLRKDMDCMRTELKGEIAAVRTELKGEIAAVRTELKEDIAAVRMELKGDINQLRNDMENMRTELTQKIEISQQFLRDVINETADALYEEQKKYNTDNDARIENIEKIVFSNKLSLVNEEKEDYNV